MKSNPFNAAFIPLLFAVICLSIPKLCGQGITAGGEPPSDKSPDEKSSDPVILTISYGEGQEAHFESHSGTIGVISVKPDDIVPMSLHFPADKIGLPVVVA